MSLLALWTGSASANEDAAGDGSLGEGGLDVVVGVETPGGSGGGSSGGSGGGGPSGPWIVVTYVPSAVYGIACPYGSAEVHTQYWPDGSSEVVAVLCGLPPEPPAVGPTPAPPPGPTAQEVRDHLPLPVAEPGINPTVRGLTGLETWFWYPGETAVTLTVTLGGYEVTATAEAVGFTWRTGDGATYHSTTPGSEAEPAATHVYTETGSKTVEVEVTWSGTYTFSGPGGTVTTDLGSVTTTSTRSYPVVEAQAVRDR